MLILDPSAMIMSKLDDKARNQRTWPTSSMPTLLSLPREKNLIEIEKKNSSIVWPWIIHRDHGHITEACIQLMNEIEEMIKYGYLEKYVCNKDQRTEVAAQQKIIDEVELPNQLPTDRMVSMIHCWPGLRKVRIEENASKRLRSNNVISFSNNDLRGIHPMTILWLFQLLLQTMT